MIKITVRFSKISLQERLHLGTRSPHLGWWQGCTCMSQESGSHEPTPPLVSECQENLPTHLKIAQGMTAIYNKNDRTHILAGTNSRSNREGEIKVMSIQNTVAKESHVGNASQNVLRFIQKVEWVPLIKSVVLEF